MKVKKTAVRRRKRKRNTRNQEKVAIKRKGKDLEDSCCELHSTALIIPLEDQMLRFNGMAGVS